MTLKENPLTDSLPKSVRDDLRKVQLAGKVTISRFKTHDKIRLSQFPDGFPIRETKWRLSCHVEDLGEPMRSAILNASKKRS